MSIPSTQTAVQVGPFPVEDWIAGVRVVNDAPVRLPQPGEVLVRISLRPINPADVFSMMGVYPGFTPKEFPAVPGMEGVGVVVAVGPEVTKLSVGQRVTSVLQWPGFQSGNGLYQEYFTGPEDAFFVVPDDVTDEQAAVAIINPVTVLGMLNIVGPVPEDGYIAITAAMSALGQMTLAVCKDRGIKTIAIVRNKAQIEQLKKLGATEVIISTDEDIVERIHMITQGKGAYAALDCLNGQTVTDLCKAVRIGGTVILYGAMTSFTFTASVVETLFRHVGIKGYWYKHDVDAMTPYQRAALVEEIWNLFRRGIFPATVREYFTLDKAVDAFKLFGDNNSLGKIMIKS